MRRCVLGRTLGYLSRRFFLLLLWEYAVDALPWEWNTSILDIYLPGPSCLQECTDDHKHLTERSLDAHANMYIRTRPANI